MKIGQVYCITYKPDDRKYIGFSCATLRGGGFEKRFEVHMLGNGSRHIKNLLNNGANRNDFETTLIFEGTPNEAIEQEKRLSKETLFPIGLNGNCGLWANTSGYTWINNGIKNKSCSPEHLKQYLNNGWKLGLITSENKKQAAKKVGIKLTGRIYINKDGKNTLINKDDIQKYQDEGWIIGKILSENQITSSLKHLKEWNNYSIGKNKRATGYIWLNNKEKSIRVDKNHVEYFLNNDWVRGRLLNKNITEKIKKSPCGSGKRYIFKDKITILVMKEELKQYLNNGWTLGKYKMES